MSLAHGERGREGRKAHDQHELQDLSYTGIGGRKVERGEKEGKSGGDTRRMGKLLYTESDNSSI